MNIEGGTLPADGDRSYGPVLLGVNWAVFGPAWIVVILRTITRVWISRNFGWDDAVIIFAQMINTVGMGFVMVEVHYGLGRHKYFFTQVHYIGFSKYNYLDWCQVFITLAISKIAICLFLLRISKFERWRNFLYGMIAFLILTHLPITLAYIFQCRPVNKAWDIKVPGDCWPKSTIEAITIVQGIFSIITDIIGAAFPILLLRNMKLPKRQKLALNALMGLGIVTAITCTIRTAFSYEVKAEDQTWDGVPNALLRMLEINFGIIAACMPMMRPLYNWTRKSWQERFGPPKATTVRTPMSRLQWYNPPRDSSWYTRLKQLFSQWRSPHPPPSHLSSTQTDDHSHVSPHNIEKSSANNLVNTPGRITMPKKPVPYSNWPQHYERPANATWAKDPGTPKLSDSFDLPLQGVRSSDWKQEGEVDWGGYAFHKDRKGGV